MLWKTGGMAFSPGRLSAQNRSGVALSGFTSHSSFEKECTWCHKPLEMTQDVLCLDCHTGITTQINLSTGTHSLINHVNRCAECHSDHRGIDFSPMENAFKLFDHTSTSFSLVWHQVNYAASPMECKACHTVEIGFSFSNSQCHTCHAQQDMDFAIAHDQDFGNDCISCHDGEDLMVRFDHTTTQFPLEGKHGLLECRDCHNQQFLFDSELSNPQTYEVIFKITSRECVGCHSEPEIHAGFLSTDCKTCHTQDNWLPANFDGERFDHDLLTGFSLILHQENFDGAQLVCTDCHQVEALEISIDKCITCHSKDDQSSAYMLEHQEQFGLECISCHDGMDRMKGFDHNSSFPLDGQHANLECEGCHIEKTFAGTPEECYLCHSEPEIHAGSFGLRCQYCHTANAWAPALLQMHEFPLEHGNQIPNDCQVCHLESYSAYSCYGCHDHQQDDIINSHNEIEISMDELQNCISCHPTGLEHETVPST